MEKYLNWSDFTLKRISLLAKLASIHRHFKLARDKNGPLYAPRAVVTWIAGVACLFDRLPYLGPANAN